MLHNLALTAASWLCCRNVVCKARTAQQSEPESGHTLPANPEPSPKQQSRSSKAKTRRTLPRNAFEHSRTYSCWPCDLYLHILMHTRSSVTACAAQSRSLEIFWRIRIPSEQTYGFVHRESRAGLRTCTFSDKCSGALGPLGSGACRPLTNRESAVIGCGMNAHLLQSGKSSRMPTNSDQTLTNEPVPLRDALGGLKEVLQVVIGPRNEAVPSIWLFSS